MQYPNPGTPPFIPVFTVGSAAANTINMVVELWPQIQKLLPSGEWMHLKCWKAAGRWGRWVKAPEGPVKCAGCGKTIARREHGG